MVALGAEKDGLITHDKDIWWKKMVVGCRMLL
jgi:hypothetical protein